MTADGEETSSKRSRGRWAGVRRGRRSGVSSLAAGPHLAVFSEAVPASVGSSLGYLNLRASSSKISTSFSSSAGEDDVLARGKCVGAGFRSWKKQPLGWAVAAGARASHSTVSAPWASERSLAPILAWKPGIDSRTLCSVRRPWCHRTLFFLTAGHQCSVSEPAFLRRTQLSLWGRVLSPRQGSGRL